MFVDENTTWRKLLDYQISELEDELESCTLSEEELDEEFDSSYGLPFGKPFTAWGKNYVYFPLEYDGREYVGYTPRNISNVKMEHQ